MPEPGDGRESVANPGGCDRIELHYQGCIFVDWSVPRVHMASGAVSPLDVEHEEPVARPLPREVLVQAAVLELVAAVAGAECVAVDVHGHLQVRGADLRQTLW